MRPDYRFPPKQIDNPAYISVLIPTRARPENLQLVFECFQATVIDKHLLDVWLYVDDDDQITLQYIKSEEWKRHNIKIYWHISKSTKSMGDMYNMLWQCCKTNPGIYFPFCDDYTIETIGWDSILRNFVMRHVDGITLGYLIDPLHAAYQVTIPVPSAQWLNVVGYFITNRFYYWFDDMWLDRIADMVQRKFLIPVRVTARGEKGKTPRMRNLPFWNRYFSCTLDDRFADAEKLLQAIHRNDQAALEPALQKARETAAIQFHKSSFTDFDSERKTELLLSDPEYIPKPSQLLNYLETELNAFEDVFAKVREAVSRNEISDALYLLDALEYSSYNLPDIDYIRAIIYQDSGYYFSAAESLCKHIEKCPEDVKSVPIFNKLQDNMALANSFDRKSTYLPTWLGIADDYFIYFPTQIDEDLYFIIQAFIYYLLNNGGQINSILVVGAGNGEGTVKAITTAYQDAKPSLLICIEPDDDKYSQLENNYSHVAKLYNSSSVSTDNFISEKKLSAFYNYIQSVMNRFPLELFVARLNNEKEYLDSTKRSKSCIMDIKQQHNLDRFDFVVLDGSLFAGEADLNAVYGATFILLTSVKSVKDFANHKRLSEDENYTLITKNVSSRAGYSLFGRKDNS